MNRFKQCVYTVILLATCLVASPFIYKQIWNSSKEKTKTEKLPPIEVNMPTMAAAQTGTAPDGENSTDTQQTTAPDGATAATGETAAQTETGTAPANAGFAYVQSDPSYFDDALFVGDSRTVGIQLYGTLKNADYFCDKGLAAYKIDTASVNGQTLDGVLKAKKYGKIYVMLGINEVGNNFDYTIKAFNSTIDKIKQAQPDALIYIMANLHVTTGAQTSTISNERINYLNASFSQLADYKTIFYIDVNPVFDDNDGALRSDASNDGVHVLANYYETWCSWLCMNTVKK